MAKKKKSLTKKNPHAGKHGASSSFVMNKKVGMISQHKKMAMGMSVDGGKIK